MKLLQYLNRALLLASVAAAPTLMHGQGQKAQLVGLITDTTKAVLPDVQIVLTAVQTGTTRTTASNDLGHYVIPLLDPGEYEILLQKEGFHPVSRAGIVLHVRDTLRIDFEMQLGAVSETITITATQGVVLESETSSLGGIVSERMATQLPLVLRDPTALVNLVPGVTVDHRQNKGTFAGNVAGLSYQTRLAFSVNGGFRAQASAMVDGIDITIDSASFSSIPIVPSPEFTQEFRVETNNLSAQLGRGAGVLNIVTKSGTNEFHGSVFEFLQNDNLNANDLFANARGQEKAESKRNQFGVAVGGPIRRDRTWFFTDWERFDQRSFLPVFTRVPTTAESNGDFSTIVTAADVPIRIYNPFDTFADSNGKTNRRPFSDNQIPQSMLAPYTQNLLPFWGMPNSSGLLSSAGRPTQEGNFALGATQPLRWSRFDVKLDHNVSDSHRLMGRYSQSRYEIAQVNIFDNVATSQALSSRDNTQPGYNAVLSWTWVVSPSLIITQAGNWSRFTDDSRNPSRGFDPTVLGGPFGNGAIVGFANQFTGGPVFPATNVSGYAPLGNGFGQNFIEPHSQYAYQLGINKTAGRHTFGAGFHFAVRQAAEDFFGGGVGQYVFTNQFTNGPDPLVPSPNTGNGLADALLGLVRSGSIDTGYTTLITNKHLSWYVQDDMRLNNKLTLNLGLRYEVERPFEDRFDGIARFEHDVTHPIGAAVGVNTNGRTLNEYFSDLTGRAGLRGGLLFPSSPQATGRGIVPTDWSNLSPRVGFAYKLHDKVVMRGGFGKLYMLSPVSATVSGNGAGTLVARTPILGTIDGVNPNVTIDNPFPGGFNTPIGDSLGINSLLGQGVTAGTGGNRTPYQWQWNFGFQYSPNDNGLLSLSYASSRGRRLPCAFFSTCADQIPLTDVQRFGSQVFESVPNPYFGIITDQTSALSRETVQLGQLLKRFPQFTSWGNGIPPWQGTDGESLRNNWDSFQLQYKQRLASLDFTLAYTISKNITNTDSFEGGFLGPTGGYQDRFTLTGERSLSSEDVPQRLVVAYVYDLPIGKGKAFGRGLNPVVERIIGGWQVAGFSTFSRGFPLRIGVTPNNTGSFGGGSRPDLIGDPCLGLSRPRGEKIDRFLNASAFAFPAPFAYGTAPRLLNCRGDGVKNTDVSLIKLTSITETVDVEFRAEFLNVFNRTQLASPDFTFGSSSFGRVTGTFNFPRVIQFGLKVLF